MDIFKRGHQTLIFLLIVVLHERMIKSLGILNQANHDVVVGIYDERKLYQYSPCSLDSLNNKVSCLV